MNEPKEICRSNCLGGSISERIDPHHMKPHLVLDAETIEIIDEKNFAHLATSMDDGSPHVSPVWIDHEGDLLLINTVPGRVKQRNVSRDPRVAISILQEKNPYKHLLIKGRVIEQTQEGALDHINRLARKYLGKDYPWDDRNRIILRIKPESARIALD